MPARKPIHSELVRGMPALTSTLSPRRGGTTCPSRNCMSISGWSCFLNSRFMGRLALCFLAIFAGTAFGGDGNDDTKTPRQLYNEGTARLQQGKLREAESFLQSAAASANETVQTAALYNLGHVRFRDGMQEYTNAPEGKAVSA